MEIEPGEEKDFLFVFDVRAKLSQCFQVYYLSDLLRSFSLKYRRALLPPLLFH
jgi:hypothetical protein